MIALSWGHPVRVDCSVSIGSSRVRLHAGTRPALESSMFLLTATLIAFSSLSAPSPEYMSDSEFRAWRLERIAQHPSADHRRWMLEALDFTTRCPHGHYDHATDTDICE
jgi:hypothetical protein